MQKVQRFIEKLYANRIQEQYDAVVPVVADEGEGKSTFISQIGMLYQDVRDGERDPEALLASMCFTREDVQDRISSAPQQSIVAVPDAARVFHKKEAMVGEQRELEKDFFDVRSSEYLILLGYQDWGSIPSFLQERRAKFLFQLPNRGSVRGYGRQKIDEKVDSTKDYDWWPGADLVDQFPSLEGTDYWGRYKSVDRAQKNERMGVVDDNDDAEETDGERLKRIAKEIKSEGIADFVSIHGAHKEPYIDADLIELEHSLSARDAVKVKKLLQRDPEIEVSKDALKEATAI